jgi:hypothetical protein
MTLEADGVPVFEPVNLISFAPPRRVGVAQAIKLIADHLGLQFRHTRAASEYSIEKRPKQ